MFPRTSEVEGDPYRRETTAMLGPLAAIIVHKPGAQLGYLAGREAYQEIARQYADFGGFMPLERLRSLMDDYLMRPRYRPRRCSREMAQEWRAMFLLGWSEQVMGETPILKDVPQTGEVVAALSDHTGQRYDR